MQRAAFAVPLPVHRKSHVDVSAGLSLLRPRVSAQGKAGARHFARFAFLVFRYFMMRR